MPMLTDRQRLELALPAYLLYALTGMAGAFVPADPALAARAEADVAALRAELRTACLEPFADLVPGKRNALIRRLERVAGCVTTQWRDRPMLGLMLMLWHFVTDLTEGGVLHLWENSAMDRALRRLLPMCEHGFGEREDDASARAEADRLLARLRAEGLYR
ncbi:hypothetical protein Q8W71_32300 [Methylobacterium sp. NEAU 140]|uniref:hypothetical protein n=1 Tax=Methylobacterium sp. NEAU 140 TaxID=3064945 RepID=UPI002732F1A8|nr:hypothetical protein [Methylobacterium sp. NEAU 140]MDP4027253.1 hypothetical protein [Methylobacterium sp. NEAU 140]